MCRNKTYRGKLSLVLGSAVFLLLSVAADATPFGMFNFFGTGNVTVSATSINWGGTPGGAVITTSGPLSYTGGTLAGGVGGTILDLPPVPIANFLTFAPTIPISSLTFNLGGLGPGATGGLCTAVIVTNCSAGAGSPFILNYTGGGTTVTLNIFGTAVDSTGTSSYSGSLTTQFTGVTPVELACAIYGPGPSCGGGLTFTGMASNSFSGNVTVFAPEPGSALLLGLGFVMIGLGAWTRKFTRPV